MKQLLNSCNNIKLTSLVMTAISSPMVFGQTTSLGIEDEFIIPDSLGMILEQGITVPIYLTTSESYKQLPSQNESEISEESTEEPIAEDALPIFVEEVNSDKQKVAEAQVYLKDKSFYVEGVTVLKGNNAHFKESLTQQLESINSTVFDNEQKIEVDDKTVLKIDIQRFVLTLEVHPDSFETLPQKKHSVLPKSTTKDLTNVTNYDFSVYASKANGITTNSSYLNYQSVFSVGENHLTVDGSFYDVGKSETASSTLNQVMFERDINGLNVKTGMANSWVFQSVGNMSALSADKVYGFSVSNYANSTKANKEASITPITALLTEPGQVLVYRDDRLLSVDNFPIGSYEIDTSRYPNGIYDVEVRVLVNGQVYSSNIQRITKVGSTNNLSNKVSWEVYGGFVKDIRKQSTNHLLGEKELKVEDGYIVGFSLGKNFPIASGVNLTTSNYLIDNHFYNETNADVRFNKNISSGLNTLVSDDGSYRYVLNTNMNLPYGIGSVWYNKENSNFKDNITIADSDSYSVGSTLNFDNFMKYGGSLDISRSVYKISKNKSTNISYNNNFYSNQYGSLGLQLGYQRFDNELDQSKDIKKYISLNWSIPLGRRVRVGLSSYNGDTNLNIDASKDFQDGFIRYGSLGLSRRIKNGNRTDFSNNQTSVNSSVLFEGKRLSGNMMISRPTSGRLTGSLSGRGSIGLTRRGVAFSGKRENSGLIIETNLDKNTSAMADINGVNYRLTGKRNFIALAPYNTYQVKLMNDTKASNSINIAKGRDIEVTLYPGNIAIQTPEIKRVVTVFGKVVDENGVGIAHNTIHNHVGHTVSDHEGKFAIDIDSRYPSLSIVENETADNASCNVEVDFSDQKSVKWIGEVSCFKLVKKDLKKQKQYGYLDNKEYLN